MMEVFGIKVTHAIFWLISFLIIFLGLTVYSKYYGTPWGKKQQEVKCILYLTKKYQTEFLIKETGYNYLNDTYQSFVYPRGNSSLLFSVHQDPESSKGYSDTYPKVYWESPEAETMKKTIEHWFPNLDMSSFKIVQMGEKEEMNLHEVTIPKTINVSPLTCILTINISSNWQKLNQQKERQKIAELNQYLKSHHISVLTEIRYDLKTMHIHEKVFFLTEDGRIIE